MSAKGDYEGVLEHFGVHHHFIEQDQKKPFGLFMAIWHLRTLVRKLRPDVIHAHMMGSALVGYFVSVMTGVPLITTVHNSFDWHSVIMRLGRRIVAVSHAEKDQLIRRGFSERRLRVIMNASVDSPRELVVKNTFEPVLQSPCITTVCGLHRRKGVFDLIAACSTILGDFPEWRLYIIGFGPDRPALEEQAQASGVGSQVIFLGAIPAPRRLFQQTEIFTLCSYADPCSLVIGEARGAGCAIVATAVGGTPEMLEFGKAGTLVPPGEPTVLATELRALMADDQMRLLRRKASLDGAEIFNARRLPGDYDQVYRSAIDA